MGLEEVVTEISLYSMRQPRHMSHILVECRAVPPALIVYRRSGARAKSAGRFAGFIPDGLDVCHEVRASREYFSLYNNYQRTF